MLTIHTVTTDKVITASTLLLSSDLQVPAGGDTGRGGPRALFWITFLSLLSRSSFSHRPCLAGLCLGSFFSLQTVNQCRHQNGFWIQIQRWHPVESSPSSLAFPELLSQALLASSGEGPWSFAEVIVIVVVNFQVQTSAGHGDPLPSGSQGGAEPNADFIKWLHTVNWKHSLLFCFLVESV